MLFMVVEFMLCAANVCSEAKRLSAKKNTLLDSRAGRGSGMCYTHYKHSMKVA